MLQLNVKADELIRANYWRGYLLAFGIGKTAMPGKTIALGCDHGGFKLKSALKDVLEDKGFTVLDVGTHSEASVDYPEFGHAVARAIEDGQADRGVIVCGSGIGISLAANRHPGIRAANCTSGEMAKLSRAHNDANVLALGERIISQEVALECLEEFLNTPFEGGRHQGRIEKI